MFCENCMSPLLIFVSFLMRLCLDQKDLHLFPLPFLLFSLSNNFSCSCPLNYFIGSKKKQVDPFSQLYWKKTSKERMFLNIWFLFFYWCLNGVWYWDSHCILCVCVCVWLCVCMCVCVSSSWWTRLSLRRFLLLVSQPRTCSSKKWVVWLHELRLICLG